MAIVGAIAIPQPSPGFRRGPADMSEPERRFQTAFWDIMTDVRAPAIVSPAPEGATVDEARVAVVIEDEEDIRSLLSAVLAQAGFTVHGAGTGELGLELVREHSPLVTTLDVNMPGMDGFETAKRIRALSTTYIVMLSARTEEIDALQGLEAGADDYVAKPFRPRELRARIDAMLRRPRHHLATAALPAETESVAAPVGWLEHRGVRLNPDTRIVTVDGANLDLTRSEFDILADLLGSGRRVRAKSDLAMMLRGEQYTGVEFVSDSDARAIEVHVANLRRKLGESPANPRWIETVRGVGYRLTA
jgi:DNA-binding response OmpR family regulator